MYRTFNNNLVSTFFRKYLILSSTYDKYKYSEYMGICIYNSLTWF